MKSFYRIFAVVVLLIAIIFIGVNIALPKFDSNNSGRPYRVEINRIIRQIEDYGFDGIDISECKYVTGVAPYSDDFYNTDSDYIVSKAGGRLYRFDYNRSSKFLTSKIIVYVNLGLGAMAALTVIIMIYMRKNILQPFERLKDVPYELSKGNLIIPVTESKNRFFGRFIWGVDLLREHMEEQKKSELEFQREKKTLLLSLSHDIKTPLSAIKLYSKALSKGLYKDTNKQLEISENINVKADEIEAYVSQIITASREDFLSLEVKNGEFYMSELISEIESYYSEKLALVKIDFKVCNYSDCIIKGDLDRGIEVIQNIIENAVKYGDGHFIHIYISEEENCKLITVKNSGCTLSDTEIPHIFDSFWRGANSENQAGSGLGLYICRQLMNKMGGEVFANVHDDIIEVTAVFTKA